MTSKGIGIKERLIRRFFRSIVGADPPEVIPEHVREHCERELDAILGELRDAIDADEMPDVLAEVDYTNPYKGDVANNIIVTALDHIRKEE